MRREGEGDSGISLIELVVAMALFALVAVMGLQSLSGTMRVSERLVEIDSGTAELGTALALLRNDIGAVVPMLFHPPGAAPRSAVDLHSGGSGLDLSLAGQPVLEPAHTDRHRAEWRLDTQSGTLYRRFWPALVPAQASQLGPEMPVLRGVSGLRLRSYWPQLGWVDGASPPGQTIVQPDDSAVDDDGGRAPPAALRSSLPLAIEVTLQTEEYGDLRLVQSLR